MSRRFVILLFSITFGCNTCLDLDAVQFDGRAGAGDVAATGDTSGADPDANGAGADMGDAGCAPEAARCTIEGRVCGTFEWVDACGVSRSEDCGSCDTVSAICDEEQGTCDCRSGFASGADGCVDIDECDRGTAMCPAMQFCINRPGSFDCSNCPVGEELDAMGMCVDTDECADGTHNCDARVACSNAAPGFACGACPGGFSDPNGDGTSCVDVDECAGGTDDCDANAACANSDGGFSCSCNSGFVGDGRVCTPQLVLQVQHVDETFNGTSQRVALPAGMAADKVVPFATASSSNINNDQLEGMYVDVWIDIGANELVMERGQAAGQVRVVTALVEFNSGIVQSGTFSLANTSTETISGVDPTRSILSFSYMIAGLSDDERSKSLVTGVLGPTDIIFERGQAEGNLNGHYYVVEDLYGQMSSNHLSLQLNSFTECTTAANGQFGADAWVLFSSRVLGGGQTIDPVGTHVQCYEAAGDLQCCRGNTGDPTAGTTIGIEAQVVTFNAASAGIQRGSSVLNGVTTDTSSLGTVDLLYTMPSVGTTGAIGAVMARENLNGNDESAAFVNAWLLNDSTIEIRRQESSADEIFATWEVVTWPH